MMVEYPTKENLRVIFLSGSSVNLKLPSKSVTTPLFNSAMKTETPGKGVLVDLSTTLPIIDISCAANKPKYKKVKANVNVARIIEIKFEIIETENYPNLIG
jgi:hypothetical protein